MVASQIPGARTVSFVSRPPAAPRQRRRRRFTAAGVALSLALAAGMVSPTASGAQEADGSRYAPFATATEFVQQQYVDILRRQPTADEVAYQAGLLEDGRDPADLIVEFVESPEANSNIKAVVRLYRTYFLRNPDHLGLTHWIRRRQEGIRLSDVSNQFATSHEFALRYGTLDDDQFIELVYKNVMNREPDAKGRQFWKGRLDVGLYRGQLMTSFSDSPEYVKRSSGVATAITLYDGMYQRSIPRGIADYLGPALQDGRRELPELVREYLDDPRYASRF